MAMCLCVSCATAWGELMRPPGSQSPLPSISRRLRGSSTEPASAGCHPVRRRWCSPPLPPQSRQQGWAMWVGGWPSVCVCGPSGVRSRGFGWCLERTQDMDIEEWVKKQQVAAEGAYRNDGEYLDHLKAIFCARYNDFHSLAAKWRDDMKQRLQVSNPLPRLLRVAAKVGLTEEETEAMGFVLLHNLGDEFTNRENSHESQVPALRKATGLGHKDIVDFLLARREHRKQGLLEVEEGYNRTFREFTLHLPNEVLTVLLGGSLSPSELLKVDKTAAAEVLAEEGAACLPEDQKDDDTDEAILDVFAIPDDDLPKPPSPEAQRVVTPGEGEAEEELVGYKDDLDYLADHFKVAAARLRIFIVEMGDDGYRFDKPSPEAQLRELQGIERTALRKCQARLALTPAGKVRVEELRQLHRLSDFEVWVVITLIGSTISQEIRSIVEKKDRFRPVTSIVGCLLGMHCPGDLHQQMDNRRCFYRHAPLLRSGVIRLLEADRELMDCEVVIDKRMLDFCVGLETEFGELVDAANVITPDVALDNVVLPTETKELILSTVDNHERLLAFRREVGLDKVVAYGLGVTILFHGPPGTGKTMMANAVAKRLKKKLLLVTMPLLTRSPDAFQQVFREATLQGAIVFMDECDTILESRTNSGMVTTLLQELERFEGLLMLATNRVSVLDEAVHRRITLSLRFPLPDTTLRERIWKNHIPAGLHVSDDINWKQLATDYELSGGFIKNAVIAAMSLTLARTPPGKELVVNSADLNQACQIQVRGHLQALCGSKRVVPSRGLASLVVAEETMKELKGLIGFERALGVVQSQWGFDPKIDTDRGTTAVFHGPKGTGKTHAAEAIAYELARPLRIMNAAEVLAASKESVVGLFSEVKINGIVLVLEQAERLFHADDQSWASFVVYQAERCGGVVIFCFEASRANPPPLRFQIPFTTPSLALREQLWQAAVPSSAPLSADVNWKSLAADFDLAGSEIKSAVLFAATAAVQQGLSCIDHASLELAARREASLRSRRLHCPQMYM
eukprot:Sspe_Gene.54561::Locus_30110_Transcript_1_1_Confidence_1.000_Length_4443::g.54561::m.54561